MSNTKKDRFTSMLDCVRHSCPTDETLHSLQPGVIQVHLAGMFTELQQFGQTPVCSFPMRKTCDKLNTEILRLLSCEVHIVVCTNKTASTHRWSKQVEKHSNECGMTAGLKAKLSLTVGARVTLRHNIDTKSKLVNGATCNVPSTAANHGEP